MTSGSHAYDPRDVGADDLDALLVATSGRVPEDVDWDAFHQRLLVRAELPLARLRYTKVGGAPVPLSDRRNRPIPLFGNRVPAPRSWWQHTAQWSRVTVSSAAAASVVLVTVIRLTPKEVGASTPQSLEVSTAVAAPDGAITRAAFESAIVGGAHASRIDTILMPSAAELLIPLGSGGSQ